MTPSNTYRNAGSTPQKLRLSPFSMTISTKHQISLVTRVTQYGSTGAVLGCLAGLYLITLTEAFGRDLLFASSGILLLIGLVGKRDIRAPRQNLILTLALLSFSLTYLIWHFAFKQPGEFNIVYSSNFRTGKTLFLAALLVFVVSNNQIHVPAWLISALLISAGIGISSYIIYDAYTTDSSRIQLKLKHATTAAFILTVFYILMLYALQHLKTVWRYAFMLVAFSLSFTAIIATGTRAAMIIYPLLAFALFAVDRHANKKLLIVMLAVSFALIATAAFMLKEKIETRVSDFESDIQLLEVNDTKTSMGARLAMFQAGIRAGLAAPLGQSAEQRASFIRDLIKQDPFYQGAELFLTNHMHNEFVEVFSERGIVGIIILAWFYVALLIAACRKGSFNSALLMITISMMAYGIADVIFYSREGYIVYLIAIVLCIVFDRNYREQFSPPIKH